MTTLLTPPAAHPWTFDGVVRFTRIGGWYLALTIVVAVSALNTGNNALYIGVSFMLGMLLLSGLASKGGLRKLELEVGAIDEAWAGQAAQTVLRIRNRSRIWNVRDVVLVSDDFAEPLLIPLLRKREETTVIAPFLFQRRGLVQLKTIDAYTRYPFGFFLKKRRLRIASEIVVYPRILSDELARERFRPIVGEQSSANRPGMGTELHSFREYVSGDSLRHVYWKKSASLGRWIIKQTDLESARAVHVVVDTFKPRGMSDEQFEDMISAATTFVHQAVRKGLDVVLTMPRTTLRAREAQAATPLFRALALVEPTYERVQHALDRNSVLFSAGGSHDAKSA